MAIKKITESPKITDEIVFNFTTTDTNGLIDDPFKILRVVIYYLERDFFAASNFSQFADEIVTDDLKARLKAAEQVALASPIQANLEKLAKVQQEYAANVQTKISYYKNAAPVAIFGTDADPAWLASDTTNAVMSRTGEGLFELNWKPLGMREGDYFVCHEWQPNPSSESLAKYEQFTLFGDTQITTSIPTNLTRSEKYEILLERYLPEMFKQKLSDEDLSPKVISEFNKCIAKSFAMLENLGNQLLDVRDANATHEAFLPILANNMGIKLRSDDPTLWRRQIRRAIPLYKKKGTMPGLEEALDQSGMRLNRFARLWQVVSNYTWQESFTLSSDDQTSFTLEKNIIYDEDYLLAYSRASDSDEWEEVDIEVLDFDTDDGVTTLTWDTDELELGEGDSLRVIYKYKAIPSELETVEDYIILLPLADARDERDQLYPFKNWNVRVIEEDDPLFDTIIGNKHPFEDDVIFGTIRTEFAYSENIYNMDEYNGSLRPSTNPCHIGREFVDVCSSCQSSMFNVDIEISNLSNNRIDEAKEIIKDYVPFHSTLHTINFSGGMSEYIQPPVERIECLILIRGGEVVVAGQTPFNRVMVEGERARRDALAEMDAVVSNQIGIAKNNNIVIFSPDLSFDKLGISDTNVLEVIYPSSTYAITSHDGHYAVLSGITDGFYASTFTFRLSNDLFSGTVDIAQDNILIFSDSADLASFSIKSNWDVENTPDYAGGPWIVYIAAYGSFEINQILPDGTFILNDPSHLLPGTNTTGITYSLKDDDNNVIFTHTNAVLTVQLRGRMDFDGNMSIDDVREHFKIGYYVLYDGVQYRISGFYDDKELYIQDYNDGTVAGTSVNVYKRLADQQLGQFGYKGLTLDTGANLELALNVQNGQNPPMTPVENNCLKENFLILIGSDYYMITDIDEGVVTLNGPANDWTLDGTSVTYTVLQFSKNGIDISERQSPVVMGYEFETIDRSSADIIRYEVTTQENVNILQALNSPNSGVTDFVTTQEKISFVIEHLDGTTEQGDI
jgi:hypothetical protein